MSFPDMIESKVHHEIQWGPLCITHGRMGTLCIEGATKGLQWVAAVSRTDGVVVKIGELSIGQDVNTET